MSKESFSSLEAKLQQLESIVNDLEGKALDIEQVIEAYSQGMQLAVDCRRALNDMDQRVQTIREQSRMELERVNSQQAQGQMMNGNPPMMNGMNPNNGMGGGFQG